MLIHLRCAKRSGWILISEVSTQQCSWRGILLQGLRSQFWPQVNFETRKTLIGNSWGPVIGILETSGFDAQRKMALGLLAALHCIKIFWTETLSKQNWGSCFNSSTTFCLQTLRQHPQLVKCLCAQVSLASLTQTWLSPTKSVSLAWAIHWSPAV